MNIAWRVLAVCLLVAASAWAGDQDKKSPVEKSDVVLVKAIQVEKLEDYFKRLLPGVVRARTQTSLSFRIPGLVSELSVDIGQEVKKGDILARLDTGDLESDLSQARASHAQALARQQDAAENFKRVRKLWADQAVPTSTLDNARSMNKSADQDVLMAAQEIKKAERALQWADLRAPFDGIVADKPLRAFQTVAAGEPVVLLIDPAGLEVRARLSPSLFLEKNDFASFTCVFPGLGNLRVPARLLGIGPGALPPSNTCPITVLFIPPKDTPILPGTEALLEISVKAGRGENLLLVPASAVVGGTGSQTQAWVVENGAVRPLAVTVQAIQGGDMAISSGLAPGQWVVTAGQDRLTPGAKVRIYQGRPADI